MPDLKAISSSCFSFSKTITFSGEMLRELIALIYLFSVSDLKNLWLKLSVKL